MRRYPPLDPRRLRYGLRRLGAADPDLARVLAERGAPPLWEREPGFATLVQIVLEQQVSLASARAAFGRLAAAAAPLTPRSFLGLDARRLRRIGFSRQKAGYCRELARALVAGRLDLDAVAGLDDEPARRALCAVRGIGPWSAEIYLLMALGRRDAWPSGDLALAKAAGRVKGLTAVPSPRHLDELAEPWRPWRAVAARLLWHDYLAWQAKPRPA